MRALVGLMAACLLVSGCGSGAPADTDADATSTPSVTTSEPTTEPAADPLAPIADLSIECVGDADPTVVLIAGLDTSGHAFHDLQGRLSGTARTCIYDRAGIGASPSLADGAPDPSPGSAVADLRATLEAAGIAPPYVVLGWSYGGLVAQAFADEHPDEVAGLVLEDAAVREQFTDPALVEPGFTWSDGGRDVDVKAVQSQLADLDFGDIPVAVLSADVKDDWGPVWFGYHDALARASSDGVHVIGRGSGHEMHVDVPKLVTMTVETVWSAAAAGSPLGACDARFTGSGGRCRA